MNGVYFFVWSFFVSIQIIVFSIYTYKMFFSKNDEKEIELLPVCLFNGKAYWKEERDLYSAPHVNNKTQIKNKKKIDQLETRDLSPKDLMLILDELER